MIRLIIRTDDANMAANVGGAVHTSYKTFDVSLPDVEAYLVERGNPYKERVLVGCELIGTADPTTTVTAAQEGP